MFSVTSFIDSKLFSTSGKQSFLFLFFILFFTFFFVIKEQIEFTRRGLIWRRNLEIFSEEEESKNWIEKILENSRIYEEKKNDFYMKYGTSSYDGQIDANKQFSCEVDLWRLLPPLLNIFFQTSQCLLPNFISYFFCLFVGIRSTTY